MLLNVDIGDLRWRVRDRLRALRAFDQGRDSRPSEHVKRRHLLRVFGERRHRLLIESGTYLGGTIEFFLPHAEQIVSVELDAALCANAQRRFAAYPQVRIVGGDSTVVIPEEVARAATPPLVWLDGHWSGPGTAHGDEPEPALRILRSLGEAGVLAGTTLLIDDIRLLGTAEAPVPLEEVVAAAAAVSPGARLTVAFDALVVYT